MDTYWQIKKVFINQSRFSNYIPILAYHNIIPDDAPTSRSDYALTVSQFESQMRFLFDQGYSSLDLMNLFQLSNAEESRRIRGFVLTFDDGFEDFYSLGYPILRKYGFISTVFLVSDLIGKAEDRNGEMKAPRMTWEQIKALYADGISFGSHTCSHSYLPDLNEQKIRHELKVSKESLEAGLGQAVAYLAYPFGESNALIRKIASQAGYQAAFGGKTGEPGSFNIWRTLITSKDSMQSFVIKMSRLHNLLLKLRGWVRECTAIGEYLKRIKIHDHQIKSSSHS